MAAARGYGSVGTSGMALVELEFMAAMQRERTHEGATGVPILYEYRHLPVQDRIRQVHILTWR